MAPRRSSSSAGSSSAARRPRARGKAPPAKRRPPPRRSEPRGASPAKRRPPSRSEPRGRRSRSRRSRSRSGPAARRRARSASGSRARSRSPPGARPAAARRGRVEQRDVGRVAAPADLPVAGFKDRILELITQNHIIVVVGETGSGKTTQIPQYLLDSESFRECFASKRRPRVAVTQPRRVAAVAMARRVAQERGVKLGAEVGYTIRFEDCSDDNTHLRYMTDGCLLRECLGDPDLSLYDVVVLDEAHERSLGTDVLFALMKRAVAKRAGQLRVLVTSATLDTGAFSTYFNSCPVLEVPGRLFNIELHYHPVSRQQRVEAAVNVALNLHVREGAGHILVFLTGMEECEQAVSMSNAKMQSMLDAGKEVSDCLIVPLYGMMQSTDQRNVFETVPDGCRKLIFSTNIAETSLTVADVGFVVDCGYCKQKNFNPKTGMESLLVTEVSQVQAKQRAGRAGRTQEGKCFRLYSEESFKRSFPKITTPEILRSNLASVTLQMKAMGIDQIVTFDFMEPPDKTRLVKSLRLLFLLGALDADGKLTDLGKQMAQFPLEPQFARVLIAANELGCADDALTLVSMLSAEGVWFRPSRRNEDQVKDAEDEWRRFAHPAGDHTTLINVYNQWQQNGRSPEWCKSRFLHFRALRQAADIRSQLADQLRKAGVTMRDGRRGGETEILEAMCAGFYMQTARMCSAGGGWLVVGENVLVKLDGGSALDGCACEWLLFTELVGNTITNVTMRNVSAVEAQWLKPLLPKLSEVNLKRLVGDWQEKKQDAGAAHENEGEKAQAREAKVGGARERYLARKAGAALAKG